MSVGTFMIRLGYILVWGLVWGMRGRVWSLALKSPEQNSPQKAFDIPLAFNIADSACIFLHTIIKHEQGNKTPDSRNQSKKLTTYFFSSLALFHRFASLTYKLYVYKYP